LVIEGPVNVVQYGESQRGGGAANVRSQPDLPSFDHQL
jgi:hypothetical protein